MTAFAVLVDWGTSSFRLWLVDGAGDVLAERRSGEGMATAGEAMGGFAGVLERQLDALVQRRVGAVEAGEAEEVCVCAEYC